MIADNQIVYANAAFKDSQRHGTNRYYVRLVQLLLLLAAVTALYACNSYFLNRKLANFSCEFISAQFTSLQFIGAFELIERPSLNALRETLSGRYPPLYYLGSAATASFTGKTWWKMNLVHNSFYLLILLVGCYLFASHTGSHESGMLTAAIAASYAPVCGSFSQFSPDFPLMGLAVFSNYLLLKSGFFESFSWSMVLALVCAWGMLVKEPFGAFVAGPVVFGLFLSAKKALRRNTGPIMNFAVFAVVLLLLISPYYSRVCKSATDNIFYFTLAGAPIGVKIFSLHNLRLITSGLSENLLSLSFFAVMLAGLYYFMRNAESKVKYMVLLWIAVPCVMLFSIDHLKSERYLLPLLPAFAVISSYWLSRAWRGYWGKTAVMLLIVLGIVQYYDVTYGTVLNLGNANYAGLYYFKPETEVVPGYDVLRHNSDVLSAIRSSTERALTALRLRDGKDRTRVMLVPPPSYVNLASYFWFNGINVAVMQKDLYSDIGKIKKVYSKLDSIDLLLQTTFNDKQLSFNKPEYFTAIKEEYLSKQGVPAVSKSEMAMYEGMWKTICATFTEPCEVSRYGDISVSLYTKKLIKPLTTRQPAAEIQ